MILSDFCPNGSVVAVEPNRDVGRALDENIRDNGLSNVKIVRSAIGDRTGTTCFHENSAYGHIADTGVTVPVMTLANLLAETGLSRVDFVKIDVEGFEPVVLRNAFDLLDAQRALIYLEFNSWCLIAFSRTNPAEFIDWLFDKFQSVSVVRPSPDGLLRKLTRGDAQGFIHDNLLKHGCVNDLVVTNHPERLDYSPAYTEKRFFAMQGERDLALAAQNRLQAERDALAAQIEALHQSSSWRITAPLRRLRTALTRKS